MENEIGKRRMISVDGWRHDEDENCAPSGCIPVEARLAPQPAPGPQVDVREIAKKVAKVTVEAFKKLADWELAAEMELRNHLSAAPEVKGYDIRKNPEPAPGPQVDVEALAHDIAMSVGTLIFNDKDWNVSKIEASVRNHLSAAQPGESGGAECQHANQIYRAGNTYCDDCKSWLHGGMPIAPPSAGRKEQE